jgi:hypothetical protein
MQSTLGRKCNSSGLSIYLLLKPEWLTLKPVVIRTLRLSSAGENFKLYINASSTLLKHLLCIGDERLFWLHGGDKQTLYRWVRSMHPSPPPHAPRKFRIQNGNIFCIYSTRLTNRMCIESVKVSGRIRIYLSIIDETDTYRKRTLCSASLV